PEIDKKEKGNIVSILGLVGLLGLAALRRSQMREEERGSPRSSSLALSAGRLSVLGSVRRRVRALLGLGSFGFGLLRGLCLALHLLVDFLLLPLHLAAVQDELLGVLDVLDALLGTLHGVGERRVAPCLGDERLVLGDRLVVGRDRVLAGLGAELLREDRLVVEGLRARPVDLLRRVEVLLHLFHVLRRIRR